MKTISTILFLFPLFLFAQVDIIPPAGANYVGQDTVAGLALVVTDWDAGAVEWRPAKLISRLYQLSDSFTVSHDGNMISSKIAIPATYLVRLKRFEICIGEMKIRTFLEDGILWQEMYVDQVSQFIQNPNQSWK